MLCHETSLLKFPIDSFNPQCVFAGIGSIMTTGLRKAPGT